MRTVKAVNIVIEFAGEKFFLADETCSALSMETGVKVYLQLRASNSIQPIAEVPEGTLEKYKHYRPLLKECSFVEVTHGDKQKS